MKRTFTDDLREAMDSIRQSFWADRVEVPLPRRAREPSKEMDVRVASHTKRDGTNVSAHRRARPGKGRTR